MTTPQTTPELLKPHRIEVNMGAHQGTLSYYTAFQMEQYAHEKGAAAALLLRRAAKQIERWSEKYGEFQPEWLPPAGDVELLEDIEAHLRVPTVLASPPIAETLSDFSSGVTAAPQEGVPDDLRAAGLTVAVHNDYRLHGQAHTFWLMTDAAGMSYKGEGRTDAEALNMIRAKLGRSTTAAPESPQPLAPPPGWAEYKERCQHGVRWENICAGCGRSSAPPPLSPPDTGNVGAIPCEFTEVGQCQAVGCGHLEQQPASGSPVAWAFHYTNSGKWFFADAKPLVKPEIIESFPVPLAALQAYAAALPPGRGMVPMSDSQIQDWIETIATYDIAGWKLWGSSQITKFARAIEAHHGIKEAAATPLGDAPPQPPGGTK